MLSDVRHRTTYRYSQPVSISHHVLRLAPRPCDHQVLHESSIVVSPHPAVRSDALDYFGNPVTYLTIQEQHEQLSIEARSRVDVAAPPPREPSRTTPWDRIFGQLERKRFARRDRDAAVRVRLAIRAGDDRPRGLRA